MGSHKVESKVGDVILNPHRDGATTIDRPNGSNIHAIFEGVGNNEDLYERIGLSRQRQHRFLLG